MLRELEPLSLLLAGEAGRAASCLQADSSLGGRFAALVERHGLLPLVRGAVAHDPGGDALAAVLPAGWLATHEPAVAARLERQHQRVRDLAAVRAALRADGIEPLLLKGPYAAMRFHGGIDRRSFGDLDLLVRPDEQVCAERALTRFGLARRSTILVSRRLTTHFTHAFDFADGDVRVDLHWRLYPHPSFRVDETRVWRQAGLFSIADETYPVLCDGEEIRFAAVSLFRDIERGAARLRHLVDLYRIVERLDPTTDWCELLRECAEEGLAAVTVNALHLVAEALRGSRRFPGLARAIATHDALIVARSEGDVAALLEAAPGALANKRWAARIYQSPAWLSFGWWAASLPFRVAVHHPGKVARLRRNLRRALGRPAMTTSTARLPNKPPARGAAPEVALARPTAGEAR